jgi:hypothetical protein
MLTRLGAGFCGALSLSLVRLGADELACVLSSGVMKTSPSESPEVAVSCRSTSPRPAALPALAPPAGACSGQAPAVLTNCDTCSLVQTEPDRATGWLFGLRLQTLCAGPAYQCQDWGKVQFEGD